MRLGRRHYSPIGPPAVRHRLNAVEAKRSGDSAQMEVSGSLNRRLFELLDVRGGDICGGREILTTHVLPQTKVAQPGGEGLCVKSLIRYHAGKFPTPRGPIT
jgi:hypothetical protein